MICPDLLNFTGFFNSLDFGPYFYLLGIFLPDFTMDLSEFCFIVLRVKGDFPGLYSIPRILHLTSQFRLILVWI